MSEILEASKTRKAGEVLHIAPNVFTRLRKQKALDTVRPYVVNPRLVKDAWRLDTPPKKPLLGRVNW